MSIPELAMQAGHGKDRATAPDPNTNSISASLFGRSAMLHDHQYAAI